MPQDLPVALARLGLAQRVRQEERQATVDDPLALRVVDDVLASQLAGRAR